MDQCDIFDFIVEKIDELPTPALIRLADYCLGEWWFAPKGQDRESIVDKITTKICDEYFDSGAADEWGPNTYADWYIDGGLNAQKKRSDELNKVVH